MTMTANLKISLYIITAALLRILTTNAFNKYLESRVEITTPLNGWKRAQEAIHLWNINMNPYLGNVFHEFPLTIYLYKFIELYTNKAIIFSIIDSITGFLLSRAILKHAILMGQPTIKAERKSHLVLMTYLFSPLAMASCASYSTTTFANFLLAASLFSCTYGIPKFVTLIMSSLLACYNMHYSTLVIPILFIIEQVNHIKSTTAREIVDQSSPKISPIKQADLKRGDKEALIQTRGDNVKYYEEPQFKSNLISNFMSWTSLILVYMLSSYIMLGNSWQFIESTYLFTLQVKDLTPNIGMFWYFFTEVFQHYLAFFTWCFQINSFIHALPLSTTYISDPYFAHYVVLLTSTIFQPYPSIANMAILFSLTFQWMELFPYLRRSLIVSCTLFTCICLWPVFWHLWIAMGTANANFYFGATLAFSSGLLLFMIDLFNAYREAEFDTKSKKPLVAAAPISSTSRLQATST